MARKLFLLLPLLVMACAVVTPVPAHSPAGTGPTATIAAAEPGPATPTALAGMPARSLPTMPTIVEAPPSGQIIPPAGWGCRLVGSVNVRSGPGVEHGVIAWLEAGEYVEVSTTYRGWYRVPGGWIKGEWCLEESK